MTRHMSPEEFRRYGHQLVDWVADYWTTVEQRPVLSSVAPGDVAARLPAVPPEHGEPFDTVLADLDSVVLPGITHWQHPSFFGYFPASTSGPSILADLVSSGLGVQGMLWVTSPACTEVETVMLDWLADLLDLPAKFRSSTVGGGVIHDTASSATLVALLVALHRATEGRWAADGVRGQPVVYASTHGHSSITKAARIAGLGDDAVRLVAVDRTTQALDPAHLRELVAKDRADGRLPALVVATIGTTSTTAIDPVPEIADVCAEERIWLHVDAAYAGSAAVVPELRWTHVGVERADSYSFNPHKWLLVGFDCSAFWIADRRELVQALSLLPEYLRNAATESGAVIDYRDWQVPLGRRFRALKLWFTLRWYGAEGLRDHIREHVRIAQEFASWVRADERFEIVAPHPFGLVCFRLRGADGRNEELLARLNASGRLYLTHTRLDDRYVLRLAIGAALTEERHVADAWRAIQEEASAL